jgi:hypothetical protein
MMRPNAALVLVASLAVLGTLTGCTGLGGKDPAVTPLTAGGAPWTHKEAAQTIRSIPEDKPSTTVDLGAARGRAGSTSALPRVSLA